MAFVKTVELVGIVTQKSPSMSGSDRLYQDRIQRETTEKVNRIMDAVREIQVYLESLP